MSDHRSFTELLAEHAVYHGGRDALVVLEHGPWEAAPVRVDYAGLDLDARALAVWLHDHGAAGERILIQQPNPLRFAVSFLACLYAGAIAIPGPDPGGPRNAERRAVGIVRDAAVSFALTDSDNAGTVSRVLAVAGYPDVACVAIDTVLGLAQAPDPDEWNMPDLDADTIALLQYTSGSTGDPRGVAIRHGNLLANQAAIQRALGTGEESVIGGWLPLHHDMGLVGQLLHPLFLGATSVLMSPGAFVRRPARWLRMISEHRITVSAAPNFGYEHCVQRIEDHQLADVDLGCWEVAVNGGEPVRPGTLGAFANRFEPFGLRPNALRPAYGLAESTLLVACTDGRLPAHVDVDRAGLELRKLRRAVPGNPSRTLVGCGPVYGAEVRIVDPEDFEVLPERSLGEIWLRGPSVARSYWARPLESADAFNATTSDGESGFMRTHDLGLIDGGELYIASRLSDLINIAGRNLHPDDLEQAVKRVSVLFGAGVAFSVESERDHVVVVQEVRQALARAGADLASLAASVRERVAEEFEVRAEGVLLVRPGTVRRTTSGKLERWTVRRLFLTGRLDPLHELVEPEVRRLVRTPGRPQRPAAAAVRRAA
jgi:acyl-CoA synthetase (AMP-forming)/AMP-acid ligase II